MRFSVLQTWLMYGLILLSSVLLPFLDEKCKISLRIHNRRYKCGYRVLLFFVLMIPLVFRTCGVDTEVYDYMFVHTKASGGGLDPLFYILQNAVYMVNHDPKTWHGVMAFISLLCIFITSNRLSNIIDQKIFMLYFVTYLYFYAFNYSRMILSVSLLFLAISYMITRNYARFAILGFISVLIHSSSLLVVGIALVFLFWRNHKRIILLIGVSTIIIMITFPSLFVAIIGLSSFGKYISNDNGTGFGIGSLLQVMPFLIILFMLRKRIDDKHIFSLLTLFMLTNIAFGLLGYIVPIASRLARFSLSFPILILPAIAYKDADNLSGMAAQRKTILIVLAVIMFVLFIAPSLETIGIVPYAC